MKTVQFKTNINCGNCVRSVKAFMDDVRGLEDWAVDTDNPDKVLTAWGDISADSVKEAVDDAGFDAELIEEKES